MAPNNEQQPHYDTHQYSGDQAADVRRVMNHMPDEDRSTTQEIQQSINENRTAELAPEVRMGDDRAIGDPPHWDGYSSTALHQAATVDNDPTTADNLGRAFNDGGNNLAEAANALYEAVNALDGAWSGVAADSAKAALSPLAQAAGVAGQTAQMMGVQMSQQSMAATEVRKLPPPKEFNSDQSLNAMLAGGPAAMQADMKAQKDAADAVKREQVSYLNAYTQALSAVDEQTPSFVPPKERIGGGGGGGGGFSGGSVSIPGTNDPSLYSRGDTTTGAPTGPHTGGIAPGSGHGFFDNDGSTDQSGYAPVPGGLGTGTSGYNPGTPPPTSFGPGGPPVGGTPSANVPGAGAGGFGAGFGSFGGGAGGAGGAAGGSGAGNANPAGPRGMTPSGMTAAGGRGGAGGGMAGAPRGKGDREEDQEHDRPAYLVEGDPESTFGSDQLTAPAVIGGDDE
ncbi:hypothetical protein [Actinophytocola sp. NPDC049390]|uniref:hypothetical protein n=1 Tax=Actinophytocola sp. NPDC049390 TaxID=3363894 RepID=UPI0037B00F87